MEDPFPAWTAVEVAGLRREGAIVEIRVIASVEYLSLNLSENSIKVRLCVNLRLNAFSSESRFDNIPFYFACDGAIFSKFGLNGFRRFLHYMLKQARISCFNFCTKRRS